MTKPSILVVEDEAVIAMHLLRTLRHLGYNACHARSGEEALQRVGEISPDLAMMDIMLGAGIDGIETARRLRDEASVPAVFLSAYSSGEILERAKLTEPMGYLIKPFREDELHTTIEVALFRAAAEKRLQSRRQMLWSAVLESLNEGAVVTDPSGIISFMNGAAQAMLGVGEPQMRGRELASIVAAVDGANTIQDGLSQVLREGKVANVRDLRAGIETDLHGTLAPQYDSAGRVSGALLLLQSRCPEGLETKVVPISSRQPPPVTAESSSLPQVSALQDALTGLPTRQAAESAIATAIHLGQQRMAAAFVLNHFDRIATRYGDRTAEELILYYSIHLAQRLALSGTLYRWPGPAFVVLMEPHMQLNEAGRELAYLASLRLEKSLSFSSRTAMVVLSTACKIFPVSSSISAPEIVKQIDAFTGPISTVGSSPGSTAIGGTLRGSA